MAVHEKNLSFAEEQKLKIAESVKNTTSLSESVIPEKKVEDNLSFKTVTNQSSVSQIGRAHV